MIEITDHRHNDCNDRLDVLAVDEPAGSGAHHRYVVSFTPREGEPGEPFRYEINFQNGGVREVGNNGLTEQALLAIMIHRVRCFQSGKFACAENDEVLSCLEGALKAQKARTKDRLARGVEGMQAT
jgi:hypothetical protein